VEGKVQGGPSESETGSDLLGCSGVLCVRDPCCFLCCSLVVTFEFVLARCDDIVLWRDVVALSETRYSCHVNRKSRGESVIRMFSLIPVTTQATP
jgi:hypothetical protein